MASLPKGTYMQGSAGATGDELGWPHLEAVPAFSLDVTEVTVRAYRRCQDAGACVRPNRGSQCNLHKTGYEDDPVNCVTWRDATEYCAWRHAELPTEAMWEYAAGGHHNRDWPFSDAAWAAKARDDRFIADHGNCRETPNGEDGWLPGRERYRGDTTCPVGSFPRGDSPEGVKDLQGNVAECTSTVYCRLPGKQCDDTKRTVKGQGYDGIVPPGIGRAQRLEWPVERWDVQLGFRCARVTGGPRDGGR